jgi:AbrB family looped-hinge helix DNA binding protein
MQQVATRRKVIKVLAKGQITIPSEFREVLGISAETLLSVSLIGDHLEIRPLRNQEESLRRYTEEEIARFIEEDKLDEKTARKISDLLKGGDL